MMNGIHSTDDIIVKDQLELGGGYLSIWTDLEPEVLLQHSLHSTFDPYARFKSPVDFSPLQSKPSCLIKGHSHVEC